ncbi:MAG: M28 family peptidase [Bacteroidota bacterium]
MLTRISRMGLLLLMLTGLLGYGCSSEQKTMDEEAAVKEKMTLNERMLQYQSEITTEFLKDHLTVYAADSMGGRESGTEYERKAADYLVDQYKQIGVLPGAGQDQYQQYYDLNATLYDSLTFKLHNLDSTVVAQSTAKKGHVGVLSPMYGGNVAQTGRVVFAGFGVTDTTRMVDHLKGLDLTGKFVLVFNEIPHIDEATGDTLIDPSQTVRSRFSSLAFRSGAAGVLVVAHDSVSQYLESAEGRLGRFDGPTNLRLAYLDKEDDGGFQGGYYYINPEWASTMLGLDSVDQLNAMRDSLATKDHLTSFEPMATEYLLSNTPYTQTQTVESSNIVGVIEGTDPNLKNEVVVLSAHYDHVGIGAPDSTGDAIYNGADDDGSGTIGLLSVAHALQKAKEDGHGPRRSVMFLSVSAEEKGLLGSRYYSDHPTWPMEETIANINVDMIGRVDDRYQEKDSTEHDYVYTIGGKIISSQLDSLVMAGNQMTANVTLDDFYNDLNDPNQFYRRSDHWNFGRLGVPFIFFFNGTHEDYHRPGDEVEKITWAPYTNRVRTIYGSVIMLANTAEPPVVDNQMFIEKTQVDPR